MYINHVGCIFVRIATVTVKMVHCCDTLILKTKTKSCAINIERLLQTSFAKVVSYPGTFNCTVELPD